MQPAYVMSPRPRKTLKKRATNYNQSIDHAGNRRLSKMWLRNQEVTNRGDSFYTLGDDNEYRHENRHLMAALRSDDLAAGPFLCFLIEDLDDVGMYAIYFWQEVEKFRESFSGMQQNDRQDAFEEILKRVCIKNIPIDRREGLKGVSFIGKMDCRTGQSNPKLVPKYCPVMALLIGRFMFRKFDIDNLSLF